MFTPLWIESKSTWNLCYICGLVGSEKTLNYVMCQVKKVNGTEIENLKHLRQLVENCSDESVRFDLDDERVIVLNYHLAKVATSTILKRHRIPSAVSDDLVEAEDSLGLAFACSS